MSVVDYLKDARILVFLLIVIALAILDLTYGVHFGMEFIGGTQIPITLAEPVDAANMSTLIGILQQRVSTFGLSQVTVQGEGSQEVVVQLSNVSQSSILNTIQVIESQGVFQGIVDGREAVNGSGIVSGSIGASPPIISGENVSWQVNFFISSAAEATFSKVAFGQANQPIYMFLDRPTDSIVLINDTLLAATEAAPATQITKLQAMEKATALINDSIPIETFSQNSSDTNTLITFFTDNRAKYAQVILEKNTPNALVQALMALNYTLAYKNKANMTPQFVTIENANSLSGITILNEWPAIGLLTAPTLSPALTGGTACQSCEITGSAPSNLSLPAKTNYSTQEAKTIASILTGGALPVHVVVGTPTTIPPQLGKESELISGLAAILAVISVTFVIVIRYRRAFLIGPIILTTLGELFIIGSIIGLIGTIDLAAVAGMIAVVGTGVDAQIIISDELLVQHVDSATIKGRLGKAFYIVWADAALLILAMLPLLFSTSLVTVIGFSESTIIGALLGAVITRPAYGTILSKHYSK